MTVTITLRRKAYQAAERHAKNPHGPMGEMAGFVSVTGYIERMVELHSTSDGRRDGCSVFSCQIEPAQAIRDTLAHSINNGCCEVLRQIGIC